MKTIEKLLQKKDVFRVDHVACMQQASLLRTYRRPDESFLWSKYPRPQQLGFKLAFIAVCHQFNWDFLQDRLYENLLESPGPPLVERLLSLTASDLSKWLSEYPKQERVRAKERASLLRDVGKVLKEKFEGDLELLHSKFSSTRFSDQSYQKLLDNFAAYRTDPLRKKTNVLSHDLFKEKIVDFNDPENIEPAIDYHIMRVYLRSGRVIPSDKVIYPFLRGTPNPRGSLVRALRAAVGEAERATALYAGLSIPDMNYIEWQIGRSICLNNDPLCTSPPPTALPADVLTLCEAGCAYNATCLALRRMPEFLEFEEPEYVSRDY